MNRAAFWILACMILTVAVSLFVVYGPNRESEEPRRMDLQSDAGLVHLKADILQEMREFMHAAEANVEYEERDVERCGQILEQYLSVVADVSDRKRALECVRTTVEKLNALNDKCDGTLIETDQREDICEFIIRAGALRGFNREDEDVTEEWRDW